MVTDLSQVQSLRILGTVIFAIAVFHTFLAKKVSEQRHRFPENSAAHNFLHYLGEVEVVFGFWAFIFLFICSFVVGINSSVKYLDSVSFAEPAFVFCIMCVASTQPILDGAKSIIAKISHIASRASRINVNLCEFFFILTIGPILGSFITEPAAMTVSALLIKNFLDTRGVPERFKYAVLGLLFVNVSIGGVFTNYAAPPVLMVAEKFGWDNAFMLSHFGWKAAIAITISTLVTTIVFRKNIIEKTKASEGNSKTSPLWLIAVHVAFLIIIVIYHKHIPFFLSLFLLFLGWCEVTKHYQTQLRLRESLLVGFFLGGLVTLGHMQGWWLEKTIASLGDNALFLGAATLTSVTDNAALTYLGSLVPSLTETAKYMLVAGSVTGGGLTVIANAPNPAGFGILRDSFGNDGISPLYLFLGALPFTGLALILFGWM